jgi:hypothetical protein
MTAPVTIKVLDITGCPFAVATEDGERLRDRIAPMLRAGAPVSLSFAGIEAIIAAFVSAAIGPLCATYSDKELGSLLTFRDLSPDGRATLERGIRNARRYYANPAVYDVAWATEMGDDNVIQKAVEP